MPLSCANSCRFYKNHCEDAQELDNQTLNQAFLVSKLASVFQGVEACIASVVCKKKESTSCDTSPKLWKKYHLQFCIKRPTPSHTTLIQTQHPKPELCPNKNLSPPSFGDNVHHDPNIELWMPLPSLVCLQRSGQDGRWTDPSVNPWQPFLASKRCWWFCRNVYDVRCWSFRKNATSFMSWTRLSDPSCNWTSVHLASHGTGSKKGKF